MWGAQWREIQQTDLQTEQPQWDPGFFSLSCFQGPELNDLKKLDLKQKWNPDKARYWLNFLTMRALSLLAMSKLMASMLLCVFGLSASLRLTEAAPRTMRNQLSQLSAIWKEGLQQNLTVLVSWSQDFQPPELSWELDPGLPRRWQESNYLSYHDSLSGPALSRSWNQEPGLGIKPRWCLLQGGPQERFDMEVFSCIVSAVLPGGLALLFFFFPRFIHLFER